MKQKVQMSVRVSKINADKLRKLVHMHKAEGETITISEVIDSALCKVFEDEEIKSYLEEGYIQR